ncbi:MAG: WXG100 family type VII secretion target [Erysipelotrichaceae bacterium]|nr:WXG100 family type VII secretion target [Erysipelotrichaceae bacterium]
MEGMIKVSPEVLNRTAQEFSDEGTQLNTLTNQMLEVVGSMTSTWQGEASNAFITKFKGLEPDMQRMFRMVQEHSRDLQEMAAGYARAEQENAEIAAGLSNEVII